MKGTGKTNDVDLVVKMILQKCCEPQRRNIDWLKPDTSSNTKVLVNISFRTFIASMTPVFYTYDIYLHNN